MSKIAEYEANLISQCTKQSLQVNKNRGVKLGMASNLMSRHSQAIENSCKTNKAKEENNPNNRRAIALLRTLLPQHLSLTEMTALLNEQGFVAPNGSKFQITQVKRLIDRISE